MLKWVYMEERVNPLPNDKFLDWLNWKHLQMTKINATEKLNFFSRMVENIMGKGEYAGYLFL